jgi:hypothetical protein
MKQEIRYLMTPFKLQRLPVHSDGQENKHNWQTFKNMNYLVHYKPQFKHSLENNNKSSLQHGRMNRTVVLMEKVGTTVWYSHKPAC